MSLLPILLNNPKLQALDLTGIAIPNSSDLALWNPHTGQPYSLTELRFAGTGISDINFLSLYPQLQVLDISRNNISDITVLDQLHNLTQLDISHNDIRDVTSLLNHMSLTTLRVSGNSNINLNDLYVIIGLNRELTHLSLGDIAIGDLNQLTLHDYHTGPYPLIELDISNTGISDIYRLQEFPTLQHLDISDNHISDLSPLSQLLDLRSLDASNNQIFDVTPLNNLTRLTSLKLSGNSGIHSNQLHFILSNNTKITELGLGDIAIDSLYSLPLYNYHTGRSFDLTYLDISNTGITDIYDLGQFPGLRYLDISDNELQYLDSLQYLIQLEELHLEKIQITDISLLNGQTKLRCLNLAGNSNIDFMSLLPILQNNPNLQALDLSGIAVPNPDDLALWNPYIGQPYPLTELRLASTGISDINFLYFYPLLEILDISNNDVSNIAYLNELHNLKELDISHNHIEDVTPLLNLTSLTTLRVSGNGNINFNDLSILIDNNQNLTRLGLGGIPIGDLFQLPPMFSFETGQPYPLIELDISNTGISDLFRLQEFPTLQHLDISDNHVSDLSPLSQLLNLRSLDASNNQITDVTALNNLTRLASLKLSNNSGISINQLYSVLSYNPGLKELGLGDIPIDSLYSLPLYNYLTGRSFDLTYLDVSNTGISNIDRVTEFQNLKYLDASQNNLSHVIGLHELVKLEQLILNDSQIDNVDFLAGLSELTNLQLGGNNGLSFSALLPILQNNQHLNILNLSDIDIGNADLLVFHNPESGLPYRLRELYLANTGINNASFTSLYQELHTLDISGNPTIDASSISFSSSLTTLMASSSNIEDLSFLSNLPAALSLDLSNNKIQDIHPLLPLTQLMSINLLGNNLITCMDLDLLQSQFPPETVIRPTECINGAFPELALLSPVQGTTVTNIDSITLEATASDAEDGDISPDITWHSDLDGEIAIGSGQSITLSVGIHTLTATITDSNGNSTSATVDIVVEQPQYCESYGISSAGEWIEKISLGDTTRVSGNNDGYANFTSDEPIPIARGENLITVFPAGHGPTDRESWKIWIDFNKDGVFSPEEQIFFGRKPTSFSKKISIPTDVNPGLAVMRVSLKYRLYPSPCEEIHRGEVEDYRVAIQ